MFHRLSAEALPPLPKPCRRAALILHMQQGADNCAGISVAANAGVKTVKGGSRGGPEQRRRPAYGTVSTRFSAGAAAWRSRGRLGRKPIRAARRFAQ